MSKEKIKQLAEQANAHNEDTCSPVRFWMEGNRFFICNDITEMDDIDELTEKQFIKRVRMVVGE